MVDVNPGPSRCSSNCSFGLLRIVDEQVHRRVDECAPERGGIGRILEELLELSFV